jgi:transposase
MPRTTVDPISLTSDQRAELEALVRAHSTPQQIAVRARTILRLAAGVGLCAVARELQVWRKTVRRWRNRWLGAAVGDTVGDRLADLPRPGAPPTFTPEHICAIVALACEPPEAAGLPITHWSQSELAREAVRRGIVDDISHRSVGRFLKGGGPQAASGARMAERQARS